MPLSTPPVAALAAVLLITLASPTSAQTPSVEPVGLGGRIEVPASGYALTVPDDWVYLFPTADDTSALMGLTAEVAPDLAPVVEQALEQGLAFSLMAFGPADASFTENCNVIDIPAVETPLGLVVAAELQGYRALGDQLAEGPEAITLELPVGESARIEYRLRFPGYETAHATYYLTDGTDYHVLTCTDQERPEDAWLSIAETFEFLPTGD